MSKSLQG